MAKKRKTNVHLKGWGLNADIKGFKAPKTELGKLSKKRR